MELRRRENGRWELRWREAGRRRSRTFDRKGDAVAFESDRVRRKQLGHVAIPSDVRLAEFVETYWRLHAVPNLAPSTRDFYKLTWTNHIMPRLGDHGVRELTPKRLARFREELERAGVGVATMRKTMAIIQSILSFAVAEELVEFNAAASVRKPRYERAREPHIFLPAEVERIRRQLASPRDRTLVAVLAYSGPRPQEVVFRLAWDDWQRRGVGRTLLAELQLSALRAGCRRLEWSAFESNRAVAALARDLPDRRSTCVGGGVLRWSAAIR